MRRISAAAAAAAASAAWDTYGEAAKAEARVIRDPSSTPQDHASAALTTDQTRRAFQAAYGRHCDMAQPTPAAPRIAPDHLKILQAVDTEIGMVAAQVACIGTAAWEDDATEASIALDGVKHILTGTQDRLSQLIDALIHEVAA